MNPGGGGRSSVAASTGVLIASRDVGDDDEAAAAAADGTSPPPPNMCKFVMRFSAGAGLGPDKGFLSAEAVPLLCGAWSVFSFPLLSVPVPRFRFIVGTGR